MKRTLTALALLLLLVGGCSDDGASTPDAKGPSDSGASDGPADGAANDAPVADGFVGNDAGLVKPTLATSPGEQKLTVTWNGVSRTVYVFVPNGYSTTAKHPLLFALHGAGEDIDGFRKRRQKLIDEADTRNVVLVMPHGIDATGTIKWNGFDSGKIDDVGFFAAMIGWLTTELAIDAAKVYFAGFSSGAGMSQRMAAERPDLVRAVVAYCMSVGFEAPVGGSSLQILCGANCQTRCGPNCSPIHSGKRGELPAPKQPISIAFARGGADKSVCAEKRCGLAGVVYDTPLEQGAFWLKANGCDTTKFTSETTASGAELRKYTSCKNGTEVYGFFDPALDHSWPAWGDTLALDFLLSH